VSNVVGHTTAITREFERAQCLHAPPHMQRNAAELILAHAINLHQLAFTPNNPRCIDPENKLLTQLAALTLRRLDDSDDAPWTHHPDPSQGA